MTIKYFKRQNPYHSRSLFALRSSLFVLAAAVLALCAPFLIGSSYFLHVVNLAGIYAIVTLGLNVVTGLAGQISLAQAAFWGLGAYCSALLTVKAGFSFWLALPVSACFAALFGFLLGVPTLKLGGHYLAMTTIGFGEIIRLILHNWKPVTNGADGLANIPRPHLGHLDFRNAAVYYYIILACLLAALWVIHNLKTSRVGRALQAIKENEVAARIVGVNTTLNKVLAFIVSAFFAGLAGSLYAHLETYISPDTFAFDQSVVFLVMLLIGGAGSVGGALIGAVLMTLLPEWLRFMKDYYMAFFGSLVIVLIIFMPSGIAGLLGRFQRRGRGPGVGGREPDYGSGASGEIREPENRGIGESGNQRGGEAGKEARAHSPIPRFSDSPILPFSDSPALLTIKGLTKRFGGLAAVEEVDLCVEQGEIRALIGPNGAGKSTLLNVLSGIYWPTEGEILFKGNPIHQLPSYQVARQGIGRTFQTARLFSELSVLENVMVARDFRSRSRVLETFVRTPRLRAEEIEARQAALDVLRMVGLDAKADWPARQLALAEQRLLEIARALALEPELILLDEPAAGMNPQESLSLMALLRQLRGQGITLLLIEHDMRVVMGISDRITVLNFGKKIAEGAPDEIHRDPTVIEAYLGHADQRRKH